jgi:GDP-L-fucose synthase
MRDGETIFVAGHKGMVGSAILRRLRAEGYQAVLTRTRAELDLANQQAVLDFFGSSDIRTVFVAAAKVGGIHANNTHRAQFLYDNLIIAANLIHAAYRSGVKDLIFLGSSCIYPRDCPQPMREEYMLTGPLEKTNEPYAIGKIAGMKLCETYNDQYGTRYVTLLPTNLYGSNDNFDLQTSHVIPAMLRKVHEARRGGRKEVVMWGTGTPKREFLHVDDLAAACVHVMQHRPSHSVLNVGSGTELTIRELAEMVCELVGYTGQIVFDSAYPDGTPRKLLDSSRILESGWRPAIDLRSGLEKLYAWYLQQTRSDAVA